jgi:hypothetical protein
LQGQEKGQEQQQKSPKSPMSQNYVAIHEDSVNWGQLDSIGVSRENLVKTNNLQKLLNWQKTDLLPIYVKNGDNVFVRTDARLSLRESTDGNLNLSVHALRKEPELERPYFGVKFTEEDRKNLQTTGNLGRIANAEYQQGEKTPVYLSIDRQTNELVAYRVEKVKIPENVKGIELTKSQQKDLHDGKEVWIQDMTSSKDTKFSAFFQFNADKKGYEFRFDNERQKQEKSQNQDQQQSQSSRQSLEAPKTFRKVKLSDDQRSSLNEGKTVYVSGLEDKKGKAYSGYVTLNKETGKTDFMFSKDYKAAVAAGTVTPDDRHKTQAAVNNDGKTNEATKNVKEPLQSGQTKPTEKQAEKQTEKQQQEKKQTEKPPKEETPKAEAPKKSKGRKV